jgi:tryptophanase
MLDHLVNSFPTVESFPIRPRPYVNHAVQFKDAYNVAQRAKVLQEVGLNVFLFPSCMVTGCDLLSDSGTTAMTNQQWAALHLGDESYGSNKGYFVLMEQIGTLFGDGFAQTPDDLEQNAFLFHQGRSGEDALFGLIGSLGAGQIIPSNGHFDTTFANIKEGGIEPQHLFSPKLRDDS